jgi:2-polyprenyl-3-methyl-5-hydroxy-6-metoxy-1,4-benzoquinol methylase
MLTKRSQEKELLDMGPDFYSEDEYHDCLNKLFLINKLLGIFHSTKKALKNFPKETSLIEIGCGGGLFILNLNKYFPQMSMIGTDISEEAIKSAQCSLESWKTIYPTSQVSFQLQKHAKLELAANSADVLISTLVCHHLSDQELIQFLQDTHRVAKKAVIIHDLHRHPLAWCLYRLISPVLFRNRLITHDGLISIRRGFKRSDWKLLLKLAGIENYKLNWCFPFRWQLMLMK